MSIANESDTHSERGSVYWQATTSTPALRAPSPPLGEEARNGERRRFGHPPVLAENGYESSAEVAAVGTRSAWIMVAGGRHS